MDSLDTSHSLGIFIDFTLRCGDFGENLFLLWASLTAKFHECSSKLSSITRHPLARNSPWPTAHVTNLIFPQPTYALVGYTRRGSSWTRVGES